MLVSILSEYIQVMRKRAGLSQEDLAAIVNRSRKTVNTWESGEKSPPVKMFGPLAVALKISEEELVRVNQQMKGKSTPPNFHETAATDDTSQIVPILGSVSEEDFGEAESEEIDTPEKVWNRLMRVW